MLRVDKNKIFMVRGDTAYFEIKINEENGSAYSLHEGDKVTFTVKKDPNLDDCAFQKTVSAGEAVTILPEDTENLECGRYFYDVQLNTAVGEVFTIIEMNQFCILQEVTRK